MRSSTSWMRLGRWPILATVVGGYLASVLFGIFMGRIDGEPSAVWTANGFLVGAVILLTGAWRIGALAICLAAQAAASFLAGEGSAGAALYPLVNLIDAVMAGWLAITFCGARSRRLSVRTVAIVIVGAVVPAAVVGGGVGAAIGSLVGPRDALGAWADWSISGALGMAIVLPALLLVSRAHRYADFNRSLAETAGLYAGLCGFAAAVFLERDLPLTFVLFPVMTVVALRLGPVGAAVGGLVLAAIGLPLTVLGHGPLMLAMGLGAAARVRLVQVIVLGAMFTSLATAGAIADQSRLRRLMIARDRVARMARLRARAAERRAAEIEAAPAPARRREAARLA